MIKKIEDLFEGIMEDNNSPSNTIGMGSLGEECEAKIWHGFRWSSKGKIPLRVARIFERGHNEEIRLIRDLKRIGIKFIEREDGKQEKFYGFEKHVAGKIDGRIIFRDEEMILEIKTMNEANFKALDKHGLIIKFPHYYSQVQRYISASGLKKCLFISVNKNTEALLFFIIERDDEHIDELLDKERNIVLQEVPFSPSYHYSFYKCKFCEHIDVCQFNEAPKKNCRTCKNVDLCPDGKWTCGLTGNDLSIEDQRVGCDNYIRLF